MIKTRIKLKIKRLFTLHPFFLEQNPKLQETLVKFKWLNNDHPYLYIPSLFIYKYFSHFEGQINALTQIYCKCVFVIFCFDFS